MTSHTDAASLLIEAADTIGDRAALRDRPSGERSMARTVAAFNALTGLQLDELQGWQFMVCLKLARATAGALHLDDYTDAAAYAALAGECMAATQQLYEEVGAELTAATDALRKRRDPPAGLSPEVADSARTTVHHHRTAGDILREWHQHTDKL